MKEDGTDGCVAHMGQKINAYRVFVGKPEEQVLYKQDEGMAGSVRCRMVTSGRLL
jgi:hypothetical protein